MDRALAWTGVRALALLVHAAIAQGEIPPPKEEDPAAVAESSPKQDETGEQKTSDEVELPKELGEVLIEVAALREEGELEIARGLLNEVLEGDLYAALLEQELEVVLAGLAALDGAAVSLSVLEFQKQVREEKVSRLSTRLNPDHPVLLTAKLNLAGTRYELGDLQGALELEEHVHAAWERLLPPDHPNLLTAKLNLAGTRFELGDLQGALEMQEHVHAARVRLLPPDHPHLLTAKLNLAVTRYELGDRQGALEMQEHVFAARERLLPPDHPDLLQAKGNLAATRYVLGDLQGALEMQEHVHAARERLLPPDHPDLLRSKGNLAGTRFVLGDLQGALEMQEQVHAARERLLPPDHPDLLRAKGNLAGTRYELGDLQGALEMQEQVLVARERLLPPDHPDLLRAKLALAVTRNALGDLAGTHDMTRSLLESQLARGTALRVESPRVARAAALEELHQLSKAIFLSESVLPDAQSRSDGLLFSVLEGLRLVSMSSGEVALAIARFPELKELHDRVADIRRALNDLALVPPAEESKLETWRKQLVEIANERDGLERELRSQLSAKGVFVEMSTHEGVAKGLEEDSALVSYFRYERYFEEDPETGERPPRLDCVLAFVVLPDARIHRVRLGPSAEIEELASRWRRALGKPIERDDATSHRGEPPDRGLPVVAGCEGDDEKKVGRELREKLLDPCLAAIGEDLPASVHVVLDDFLHLLPVDALPWKNDNRVGEVLPIHLEVSVQRLIAPPRPAPEAGSLVALGGVDFGAEGIDAPSSPIVLTTPPTGQSYDHTGAPEHFGALIQSRYEVEALGGLYEELAGGKPVVLTKAKASKKALVELAPTARYLHVASHGWFSPEVFKSMMDTVGEGDELQMMLSRAEQTVTGFAPATLCGLALAGASHGRNSLGKVPGIMTAEELATLDLSNCELAVLSACETNVGRRRAGQGIQSLQSALHAAGARTAITSLWKVDDAATRLLMELFYTRLWKEGSGKADALWQAKMALRTEGHSLRDWAGWVLTGDPES